MKRNPYLITGPALISFSGGRTSAYMLKHIIDAHGGSLPDDVFVCFANTGKEREETLRFVHECGSRWACRIIWLEWHCRLKRTPVENRFGVVGFNSAARNGEPFDRLIDSKKALPNQAQRWCTEHLKVQVMHDYMLAANGLEWGEYTEVIGLRYDEFWRFAKGMDRAEREGRKVAYPLMSAKVSKPDVARFWQQQDFDLGLLGIEGNCDLCFMKGSDAIGGLIRKRPESADWWDRAEKRIGATFRSERPIATIARDVERQPDLWTEPDEFDAECGLWCGEAA